MSRAYEEHMEEQQRKKEQLLEVPKRLANTHDAITALAERLEESAVKIAILEDELKKANSSRNKLRDYAIGFILGILASLFATQIAADWLTR